MKPPPSPEDDEKDQEITKLLKELGSFESKYPPELLTARRAAFLAEIERFRTGDVEEGLAPRDQEIVKLLRNLKSTTPAYPPDLLAARRSAFMQQIGGAETVSLLKKWQVSIRSIFQDKTRIPVLMRTSLVVASLIAAAFIGFLLFRPPASHVIAPARTPATDTYHVATILCKPDDQRPPCPLLDREPSQDLAGQGNGVARPAVSSDVGIHKAAYINDGRSGTSWVSNSANSWIKIDLGKVTTINSISLQKGSLGSSDDHNPGQFVIAVAQSDFYTDGNNSNDYIEYAQVFNSEQTDFSGTVLHGKTIRTLFPPVKARFVKITFQEAGAAIGEVGVFMVQPSELVEQPTKGPQDHGSEATLTPLPTNTLLPMDTATPLPTDTLLPVETLTALPTDTGLPTGTPIQILTDTPYPSDTPIPLPTGTLSPAETSTPVPTLPLPSETPLPLLSAASPTAIPPTAQPLPAGTDIIIITGNDQTLTFTCNDNAVEVRGHANTVTLLGSCSSITVTGNRNNVFWQSGSPVITNKGNKNTISHR